MEGAQRAVDGREIAPQDRIAPLAIRLLDRVLDLGDRLVAREDARQGEEAGLHDRVDPAAEFRLLGHRQGVDNVELQLLVDDLPPRLLAEGGPRPRRVRRGC